MMRRSLVKQYALEVSAKKRAGKFTRVAEGFYISCEAELEAKLTLMVPYIDGASALEPQGIKLLSPKAKARALEQAERLAARIIHGRVMRHPSIGKTLMS